jgi:hypothetical protein
VAEVLSTLVMSVYVPKGVLPLYTLIWRLILSYYPIAFGFLVFSHWVRRGIKGMGETVPTEVQVEGQAAGLPIAD